MTFTEFNQPPLCGNLDKYCGNSANKKNGEANAVENAIIPSTGQKNSPRPAATSSNPTNWTVHVKEVKVKVKAMNKIPSIPPLSSCCKLN